MGYRSDSIAISRDVGPLSNDLVKVFLGSGPFPGAAKLNCSLATDYRKKPDVHKISARYSGAGNVCANFMGAWHFLVLSDGKPPCP